MTFSLVALWKKDTALNTYIFGLFLIGLPLTLFVTYVGYHLQVVGNLIGTDANGRPCVDYCLVPFGGRKLDLNSALLYLIAMGFGLGGASAMLISAYADFWKNKSSLIALLIVCYGAVSIPVYWLRHPSLANFHALMALFVIWGVITTNIFVMFGMLIPHYMRIAEQKGSNSVLSIEKNSIDETKTHSSKSDTLTKEEKLSQPSKPRKFGFKMTVFGGIGISIGGVLGLTAVIILSQTLPVAESQAAGLLVTTVAGFITILGSIVVYLGLPAVPAKPKKHWKAWWIELFTPLRDLLRRRNIAALLLSYTIYNDVIFAMYAIISQLYFKEIKPDTLEFSLYSMSSPIFGALATLGLYFWQTWRPPFKLEYWLVIGFSLMLIVPLWGCIGLIEHINFGFKNRWEFYIQNFIFSLSNSIVNSVFRVLFSELIPKGSEMEWFGLQVVLSCATGWISYILNAPIQNATHQLRFPLVICLIILAVPVLLEIMRCTMETFVKDKVRWQEHDAGEAPDFNHGS